MDVTSIVSLHTFASEIRWNGNKLGYEFGGGYTIFLSNDKRPRVVISQQTGLL